MTEKNSRKELTANQLSDDRVAEYDILRVIVMLLVVLGHATYVSHVTDYGGCDYSEYFEKKSLFFQCVSYLTAVIYLFHMPLFMALSGALFYCSYMKGKYRNYKLLLVEKGKRLLIPFSSKIVSTYFLHIKLYKLLLRNTFGIYLYADPLNYLILAVGFALFGKQLFTDMFLSIGLYFVRIIGTITVSIALCCVIRKCKLKYLC